MASLRSQMTKERTRIKHQLKRMIKAGYAVDIDLSWSYDATVENLNRLKSLSSSAIYQSSYWYNPINKEVMIGEEAVSFRRTKAWKEYNKGLQQEGGSEMYNVIEAVFEEISDALSSESVTGSNSYYAKAVRRRATEINSILSTAINRDGYETVARRMQKYADLNTTVKQRIWDSKDATTEPLLIEITQAINGSSLSITERQEIDNTIYSIEEEY